MKGIDLFDVKFTNAAKSEEELSKVEQQLLERGFDAILFTKVLGSENKETFSKKIADLTSYYSKFREDYIKHQDIYFEPDYDNQHPIYYAETSLYCICPDKERELIWRSSVQLKHPTDTEKTVDDYVKLVVKSMEDQDLIFETEKK